MPQAGIRLDDNTINNKLPGRTRQIFVLAIEAFVDLRLAGRYMSLDSRAEMLLEEFVTTNWGLFVSES